MKKFDSKLTVILTCFFFLQFSPALANGLINNNAQGYVYGSISQNVGAGGRSEINIGSIVSNNGAKISNVNTRAAVMGDIVVDGNISLNIASVVAR